MKTLFIRPSAEELTVGRALLGANAAFSIGKAPDGGPVAFVYSNGQHIGTVAGTSVTVILRNLCYLAEQIREIDSQNPVR